MSSRFRDSEHLVRLAGVILVCVLLFLGVRRMVIPEAFGQLGHYRPAALDDNRAQPLVFAGQGECVLCHEAQDKERKAGRHATVACEACHGPQAVHANEPSRKPAKPDVVSLCRSCHEKDAAKPAGFPQVVIRDHNAEAGLCNGCHQPHQPKL